MTNNGNNNSEQRRQTAIIKRILRLKAHLASVVDGYRKCDSGDLNRLLAGLRISSLLLVEKALKAEARDASATGSTKKTWSGRSGQ